MVNGLSNNNNYTQFNVNGNNFSGIEKLFSFETGYRFHLNLIKNKDIKWNVSLGFGANLFNFTSKLDSRAHGLPETINFKRNTSSLTFVFDPTVSYHINNRLFLRFGVTTNLMSLNMSSHKYTGTNLEQLNGRDFSIKAFPAYIQTKLGLAFKL